MTEVLYGPQLGKEGRIRLGCSAVIFDETRTKVLLMVGVYSNPDQLVIYPDGAKVHIVVLGFEAEVISDELRLSDETTGVGFFLFAEMESRPMHGKHKERVDDAFSNQIEAFIVNRCRRLL
ncbi:MAG TPA: hypothetical protein VKE92_14470 [Anaerolineales bacterium]|nr:hypothetical protein [Anaerolineales bacterium]